MQQLIFDRSVVPGQDSLSVAETAERLETALTEQQQLLADAGGIPIQHELVICTRSEATEVSLSYAISDPSGHLSTELPAWLDSNPHGSYADPARDSVATAWDLPLESAPNRPTDLEALQNQDRLKQDAQDTVLLRMEPVNQDPIDGATRRTPPQESLPDAFHWDPDPDTPPMPIFRWLRDSDTDVLLRIHLDPVFRIEDTLVSAEYCYHTDTTLPADETAIEAVGYRPTIEAALQAPENEEIAAATELGDLLSALLDTGDYVPTIYRAVQPAPKRITSTDVRQDNSPVQYSTTHHEIITDGLARMKAGRGRPVRATDGESRQLSPVSPSNLASLYRVPAAPTLAREGIDIPGVDSTLTTLPPEVTRHMLADEGITIGTDPGVVDDPLRLSQSATPPTQTIVSDDSEMYAELLAQQTIQRDDPAGTTLVVDPTGDLAASLQRFCAEQYDDREVIEWDIAAQQPALSPFDITRYSDTDWDQDEAIRFVTDTHDYLLQASASEYRVTTSPETLDIETSQLGCREQFQAAFRDAAPEIDYATIVAQLNDDRTRRALSHYVSPRFETDVTAGTADTAYHLAANLSTSLDPFLMDTDAQAAPLDLLTATPNAILCLDVSGFDDASTRRLASILLLRELAVSIACNESTTIQPVTVTLAGVSLFLTTDFLTPLITHARDSSSLSLDVLFGICCGDDAATIPHPAHTYESPLYLIATTSTFDDHERAEQLLNHLPDTLPAEVADIKQQATADTHATFSLAAEYVPEAEPITCTVTRPLPHSSQQDEDLGEPASETTALRELSANTITALTGDTESGGPQQLALTAEIDPAEPASASESCPIDGVCNTHEGPTCATCGTVYERVSEATTCHNPDHLADDRRRGTLNTSLSPPDLAYSQRVRNRLDTSTTTNIADAIRSVATQPSYEEALATIRENVPDNPSPADSWSLTFLVAIELARLGCLPGYTLHESMTTIRDDCLSRSAYTADELTDPPSYVEYDNPLISTFKFDGNRYYELSSAATDSDLVPHAMDSSLPVLGTPLHYNLGVVFGSHHIAAEHDVTWIQAPHTLCTAGMDAFAGFDDDDTLQVLGTVIDQDPYQESESTEQRHGSPAQSGQLHDYITHQYRRAAEVSAETVWITRNTRIARGVLDVLADEDQIDLSRTVYESSYSIGQLQTRFVADLQPDGLDSLHTLKQLHQQE